jgi:hypothetical protein
MLKLSMKKLGTPVIEPPSAEGSGGVSEEGDTPLTFGFALGPEPGCPVAVEVPLCDGATVRRWRRCVRTSGAGTTVVVSVVVVVVDVLVGGAASGVGGAGTVVVPEVVGGASVVPVVAVVSASAPAVGSNATSATSRVSSVFLGSRRII